MIIVCAVLATLVGPPKTGSGTAFAADSVTISAALLDSFFVRFDSLEMDLRITRVNLDKMTELAGDQGSAWDSFFKKWYVWGGLFAVGFGAGYYATR